jgi:hypothetical protein
LGLNACVFLRAGVNEQESINKREALRVLPLDSLGLLRWAVT